MFINHDTEAGQRPVEEVTYGAHSTEPPGVGDQVHGTVPWIDAGSKLEEAVDHLKTPTVFSTYSASVNHWNGLQGLIPRVGHVGGRPCVCPSCACPPTPKKCKKIYEYQKTQTCMCT